MNKRIVQWIAVILGILFVFPVTASATKQVIIDPGHGGLLPGTTGYSGNVTGYYEKHANLEVALKLRDILKQKGYTVHMTRDRDIHFSYPAKQDLEARMKVANSLAKHNNDQAIFISIHHNASVNTRMRGYETYYFDIANGINLSYPPDPMQVHYSSESRRLAQIVHRSVLQHVPIREGDGLKANNLYVTRNAQMASVLVELGYMSNPYEERLIKTDAFQQQAAQALAAGIDQYYHVYEVYRMNGERLRVYFSKERALDFAELREEVYVLDKANQVKIYSTGPKYNVEHVSLGIIFQSYDLAQAQSHAKLYKNTAVINEKTGELIWSNYLPKTYQVKHHFLGELFASYHKQTAIDYSKKWKNTTVVDAETGEVLWSNYVRPYIVEHSLQGALFTTYNLQEALKYAKQWKHTAVYQDETKQVLWKNY